MTRLAVMATWDPTGEVGPHIRYQVDALLAAYDEVVVVTTTALSPAGQAWLRERVRLIERDNSGHDFGSYRAGLAAAGPLERFEAVTLCNDSFIGPLRPYRQILDQMRGRADFWGITRSERIAPHVQSFFITFHRPAFTSAAFTSFWDEFEPLDDRMEVIRRYEVGLSTRLHEAGLQSAAYLTETDADRALARRRVKWWAWHRGPLRSRKHLRRLRRQRHVAWNPSRALADLALDDGRMPFLKLDTLRLDPYALDADRLITLAEERYPEAKIGRASCRERVYVLV